MDHRDDFICPICGAVVPARAKACPECGSDERTGWSDNTIYDGTDIEDSNDEFDYEDWLRRQGGQPLKLSVWHWVIWAAGVLLLLALVFGWIL